MSKPKTYEPRTWEIVLFVSLLILGAYQFCQCVGWTYDAIVSHIAADIQAKRDDGRYVTDCSWDKCRIHWVHE
jgi:hypothetical protein